MKTGDAVRYRSMSGDVYDAVIVAVRLDGRLDLDVTAPGCAEPVRLTKIEASQCQ